MDESHRRVLPVVPVETSQALCRTCALCCDGTLFLSVPLEVSEVVSIKREGAELIEIEKTSHLPLPCEKLASTTCSIYAMRPKNCRGYRCGVLRRLENGELQADDAHAVVNKAVETVLTIRAHLPSSDDRSRSIWTRIDDLASAESLAVDGIEFSRRHPNLGMQAIVLQRLLDLEFVVAKSHSRKSVLQLDRNPKD